MSLSVQRHQGSLKSLVFAALVMPSLLAQATEPQSIELLSMSRFERTILALQRAPAEDRANFALIALSQLTETYYAEADLARHDSTGSELKQMRWSRAVERYARQMITVQEDIANGFPVALGLQPKTEAIVIVDGRRIPLSHPRPLQQSAFEQQILAQFCESGYCDSMSTPSSTTKTFSSSLEHIKPQWTFTATGPACSQDGLHFTFAANTSLGAIRPFCESLFREINTLLNEIHWQQQHDVTIEWQQLLLSELPAQSRHMLQLNAAGDTLLLELPVIFRNSGLLTTISPWLAARLSGNEHSLTIKASTLDWSNVPLKHARYIE